MKQKLYTKALLAGFFLGAGFFLLGSQSTYAATITVTPDAVDETTNGNCSLFEAAEAANTDTAVDACPAGSGADTLTVPDGTYDISANSVSLYFTEGVTLTGQSREGTIFDGAGDYGIGIGGSTPQGSTITIQNLTVQNASASIKTDYVDIDIIIKNVILDGSTQSQIAASADTQNYGSFSLQDSIIRNGSCDPDISWLYSNVINITYFTDITVSNVEVYDNGQGCRGIMSLRGSTVQVQHTNIFNNTPTAAAEGDDDGGLAVTTDSSSDSITILDTDVYNNTNGVGMALYSSGELAIRNSSVVNHQGSAAILVMKESDQGSPTFDITNVTLAHNKTLYPALAIGSKVPMAGSLKNVTIANNDRSGDTGGMPLAGGWFIMGMDGASLDVTAANVLLAGNTDEGAPKNCASPTTAPLFDPVSLGGNLSDDATCGSVFSHATDQNNISAGLGSLTEDAGTWVMPLLANSPAVDTGVTVAGITEDQRGAARPQGGGFDIGAYESGFTGTTVTSSDENLASTGQSALLITIVSLISLTLGSVTFFRRSKHLF